MAYPYANHYLAQFPKDKTEQASAFIAFVAGAFAFVLFMITIFDSEFFLNFEITPGTTALFWIGLFSAVYRVARSSSPQEGQVADPEYYIQHVIYHTHYEPASWRGRLHTDEVRAEFAEMYQPKVLIFAEEILSMVITPFLLIFRLPNCSARIVDFFREFSIVVDGVGVVCSYSMFGFNKNIEKAVGQGTRVRRENPDLREDHFNAKDDKMVKSYFGFLDTYALNGGKAQPRGAFHPPPQFPNAFGAMSQTAQPVEASVWGNSKDPVARQRNGSRYVPSNGRDEAINSILLDPHHQPSASAMRGSPRTVPHVRYRSSLHPVPDPSSLSRQNSRIEEESTLGDSWRTGRFAEVDEDGVEMAGRSKGGSKGGVLQLLQQFSKAQTEGRGVKVGI
jgi:autophagy-related protein 9